jgi:hypothetical protein
VLVIVVVVEVIRGLNLTYLGVATIEVVVVCCLEVVGMKLDFSRRTLDRSKLLPYAKCGETPEPLLSFCPVIMLNLIRDLSG